MKTEKQVSKEVETRRCWGQKVREEEELRDMCVFMFFNLYFNYLTMAIEGYHLQNYK